MLSRSLRYRAPLLWLVLPLMAGLAAGRMGDLTEPRVLLAGAVVAALVALAAAWRAPRAWAVPLVVAMFLAGAASQALHERRLPEREALPPREAKLTLRIDRVFAPSGPDRASGLATITATEMHLGDLRRQRIYFSIAVRKGDKPPVRSGVVSVLGVIAPVSRDPPPDTFESYLANAGLGFRLSRGRMLAVERPALAYYQFCERLAARMNALLSAGLEDRPEIAAVYRAMMLGQKHELSEEQHQLFMHSGTMHLFAINGLHIGVVALALHFLLALLRCPRLPSSLLVLAVLWLDVDTTGASPSAVRAFLMVAMLEASWGLRRPVNPLAALAAAAALVLVFDPLDFFSASFQMSHCVVTAIVVFGLPLAEWMKARWPAFPDLPQVTWAWHHRARAWARRRFFDTLSIGCSATLVSALSGVEFFSVFATGALVANLVLVPLASVVIMAGFASLVLGLSSISWAGRLCNEAAGVLLRLIDWLIRLDTNVPGSSWTAHFRAGWIGPASLVALVAALLSGYAWGWRKERGGFWPPVVVVVVTLALGVNFG
ncbi:MAG: ComEC/Rec2 family competence protein [Verrucomicrobiota bacterium]